LSGYWLARWLDVNVAAAMATMTGVFFLTALVFTPGRGLISRQLARRSRRRRFAVEMLVVHLSRHEGKLNEAAESMDSHLTSELNWARDFADATIRRANQQGLIQREQNRLRLTDSGRLVAQQVLSR
jgi:manganese/zinc/iron transport system permease protein